MKPHVLVALGFAVAATALPAISGPPASGAADGTCLGLAPTVSGSDRTLRGTKGDDVILGGFETLTVLAGGGDDLICTSGGTVKAGRGADLVIVEASGFPRSGELKLGRGQDDVWSDTTATVARLDLRHGRLTTTAGEFDVTNAEAFSVGSAHAVYVRGGSGDDVVDAQGCRVKMRGGAGNDTLRAAENSDCSGRRNPFTAELSGEGGDDVLGGTRLDDLLRGGPGHDVAIGAGGVDRCRTEVRKNCER